MKPTDFIKKYKNDAIIVNSIFHIPVSIILSQSALETGWGESNLAKNWNNMFGIKCHGRTYCTNIAGSDWRAYNKKSESFMDYGFFLTENQRYNNCFNNDPLDYKKWANCLQNSGYAGNSTTYANKLIKIIEDYNLDSFDQQIEDHIENQLANKETLKEVLNTLIIPASALFILFAISTNDE
jgi:flagellum-specific peptidoglycan hydrolase FlgJ